MVTIELFGMLRVRSGCPAVTVPGRTVGEALHQAEHRVDSLAGALLDGEELVTGYRISLNGTQFVSDLAHPLEEGDVLLVISADAGG